MKRKTNKIVSLMLVFCIMVSLVTITGISANATTGDTDVSSGYGFSYTVTEDGYARIVGYYGRDTELVIPKTIDGYTVKYIGTGYTNTENHSITVAPITSVTIPDTVTEIGEGAFRSNGFLKSVTIPNSVTSIGRYAFGNCIKLTNVSLPESVTYIGDYAFAGCNVKHTVVNKNVVNWGYGAFDSVNQIYVHKGAEGFSDAFAISSLDFSDIYYEGSKEEWDRAKPSDFFMYNHYINMHFNHPIDKTVGFASVVSDDFTLNLTQEKGNIQSGEIVLQPGTYQFNIHKGDIFNALGGKNIFGYNKIINDSTSSSLTCKPSFKTKTTLVATGGTYNFSFNTQTDSLSIKRTGDIPKVYIVGENLENCENLNLVLKPISGTNLSVGSIYLPNNTYSFKVVKDGVNLMSMENNAGMLPTSGSSPLKLGSEGTYIPKLLCSGGLITFTFNHDTNELLAEQLIDRIKTQPVYNISIEGCNISLDLDDNNGESNIATGTITLKKGAYPFKVYNRGVACGSNSIYFDKGTRTLSPNFMLPSVLYASGGKYKFTFEKSTGRLFIHRA